MATELPMWAVWLIAVAVPLASFASGLLGQWLGRKGAREQNELGRRQETLTNVRWAAEMALSEDVNKAKLGVGYLRAVDRMALDEETQGVVGAALEAVVSPAVEAYDAASGSGTVDVEEE